MPSFFLATNLHMPTCFLKLTKLNPHSLKTFTFSNIPVRLIQSASTITTFRITAFLENILQPISRDFCNFRF